MKRKRHRRWRNKADDYLIKNWGVLPLDVICSKLNRSKNAIKLRAFRLNLGAARDNNPDYITVNCLMSALYGDHSKQGYNYEKNVILPKLLKIYMIPQPNVPRRCVKLSEFWEAAEANRHLFNFSNLERYALGPEPDWVDEQRRIDERETLIRQSPKAPWTAYEDSVLRNMAAQKRYTCREIAERLKRSEGAVARRITDLGLNGCTKKCPSKYYTQAELDTVADLIIRSYPYPLIAKQTGRSEKSLRGMIYQQFHTEKIGTARARLLSGEKLTAKRKEPYNEE